MGDVECFGCGAAVPDIHGPTHAYMLSAPGCWNLECSLLDWKTALDDETGITTAQQVVDAYAAQHSTNPDRRNRQSVAVHLMSLCACLEDGLQGARLRASLAQWTRVEYPELLPRPDLDGPVTGEGRPRRFEVTVRDVVDAARDSRSDMIVHWAEATWSAWSAHHETVRAWLRAQRAAKQEARHPRR